VSGVCTSVWQRLTRLRHEQRRHLRGRDRRSALVEVRVDGYDTGVGRQPKERAVLQAAVDFGIDISLLESNLALSPAERVRELVAMNRLHAEIQARTLTPEERARLDELELQELVAYLGDEPALAP
jgi:hypothetical protein